MFTRVSIPYFIKYFLDTSARHFLKIGIIGKYQFFEIRLEMVDCQQSKVYWIEMAGKYSQFGFGEFYRLFLEINTFILFVPKSVKQLFVTYAC